MKIGFPKVEIPRFLIYFLKLLLLIGGAWLIFTSIGDATMSLLQYTENLSILNFDFLLSVFIRLLSEIVLGALLISFVMIGKGKLMNVFWLIGAVIYSVYALYSFYEFFRFNLGFFKHFSFSFDGLLNICEFLLYISFLISISLICFCNNGLLFKKIKKIVPFFIALGLFYLFSTTILSLFNYGEMTVSPIFESIAKMITIALLYAFSALDIKESGYKEMSKTVLSDAEESSDVIHSELYKNDLHSDPISEFDSTFYVNETDNSDLWVDDFINQIVSETTNKINDSNNKDEQIKIVDQEPNPTEVSLDDVLNKLRESINNFDNIE